MAKQHPVQQEELHHPQGAVGGDIGRLDRQGVPAAAEVDGARRHDTYRQRGDHQACEGERAERRDLARDGSLRVIEPDPTAIQLEGGHRPDRRREHVGERRVHTEDAHEDAQNDQAGDGGDAGHGGVAQQLRHPAGPAQRSVHS